MRHEAKELSTDRRRFAAFAAALHGATAESMRLDIAAFRGGLGRSSVYRVAARAGLATRPATRFVVKRLPADGAPHGELDAYRRLGECGVAGLAPRVLGVERAPGGEVYLYLEHVVPYCRWPWRDVAVAGRVLESLAVLHAALPSQPSASGAASERELAASAAATLERFEASVRAPHLSMLRGFGRHLGRLVERLADVRGELYAHEPAWLHGDVHPGNVLMRRRSGRVEAVLIDWERSRLGSPLEDVSSWLQSLAYWEPEARRRHDTLLGRYLAARGTPPRLTRELRDRYWLAAASNALAGALRYHLSVAAAPAAGPRRRDASAAAARDWLRVVRRGVEALGASAARSRRRAAGHPTPWAPAAAPAERRPRRRGRTETASRTGSVEGRRVIR